MASRSLVVAAMGCCLNLTACSLVSNTSDYDAGGGSSHTRRDSGRDAGSPTDSAYNASADGPLPDVVAASGGYRVTQSAGAEAASIAGTMPAGDPNSGTRIEPFNGNTTFIPGGTNRFAGGIIGGPVSGLLVGIEGFGEYYQLDQTSLNFVFFVTLAQDFRRATFTLLVTPIILADEGNPTGGYGQTLRVPCSVQQVGTGDLQVSLSFDTLNDVDLHLVEPSGEEIYYGHGYSAAGGQLDLDSNAGCSIDGVNNENITYQNATPPNGHYSVRVDFWDDCDVQATVNYVVTVNIRGTPQVFQGTFAPGNFDHGGSGDGVVVTEFDF